MKDRLEELRNRVDEGGDHLWQDDTLSFDNPVFLEDENGPLSKAFQEMSSLSLSLDKLEELSENIYQKQQEVLCCTTEESICTEKRGLAKMKDSFTAEAKAIQPRLGSIQEALPRDGQRWLAVSRIRQSQASALIGRYRDIITRHYAKETQYVEKLKEQISRQTQLAGLTLQEEDIRQLAEGPLAPRIVGQDLDVPKAQQHLAMAQVRHRQLLDLEAQIRELLSLFLHLEILVAEQQETIDSIEHNVLQTLDYVSQSNEEVKRALKYERQSRFLAALSSVLGLCACCACLPCVATPNVVP
ncbi:hypothetical protein lerEdw1_002470 [Lerista edwardsae]|nr:hypothetical protein lerEdw1_002470 [Lerista edwardsae]